MGSNAVTPCNLLENRKLVVSALVLNASSVAKQTVKGGGQHKSNWGIEKSTASRNRFGN
jgi:hypothetical protein